MELFKHNANALKPYWDFFIKINNTNRENAAHVPKTEQLNLQNYCSFSSFTKAIQASKSFGTILNKNSTS